MNYCDFRMWQYQDISGAWLGFHNVEHMTDVHAVGTVPMRELIAKPDAPQITELFAAPPGWRLVKQERLDEIQRRSLDPSIPCYLGRNCYDDSKVHQNWDACRANLSSIKDEIDAIDGNWDSDDLLEAGGHSLSDAPYRYHWEQYIYMDNGPGWQDMYRDYDPRLPENTAFHSCDFNDPKEVRNFTPLYRVK